MSSASRRLSAKQRLQDCVSKKIRVLMHEGYPQKQAIAIAFSMCEKRLSTSGSRRPQSRRRRSRRSRRQLRQQRQQRQQRQRGGQPPNNKAITDDVNNLDRTIDDLKERLATSNVAEGTGNAQTNAMRRLYLDRQRQSCSELDLDSCRQGIRGCTVKKQMIETKGWFGRTKQTEQEVCTYEEPEVWAQQKQAERNARQSKELRRLTYPLAEIVSAFFQALKEMECCLDDMNHLLDLHQPDPTRYTPEELAIAQGKFEMLQIIQENFGQFVEEIRAAVEEQQLTKEMLDTTAIQTAADFDELLDRILPFVILIHTKYKEQIDKSHAKLRPYQIAAIGEYRRDANFDATRFSVQRHNSCGTACCDITVAPNDCVDLFLAQKLIRFQLPLRQLQKDLEGMRRPDMLTKVSDVISELSDLTSEMNNNRREWEAPVEGDEQEEPEEAPTDSNDSNEYSDIENQWNIQRQYLA